MSLESGSPTFEFLRRIWPEGFTYCIAVKAPGNGAPMRQTFFTSIQEASAFAVLASSRGLETYHACAVFNNGASRKAANVAGVRALWLDIDVGPKKPYPDERAGLAALFSFCNIAKLPIPTIVHSGGGWHVYWELEEILPANVWQHFANALRDACHRYQFHADAAITIDVARILRPVGTFNYKRATPAPVELRRAGDRVSARVFAHLGAAPLAGTPPVLPPGVDNSKFEVKAVHNDEPSFAAKIVQGCKQLAMFRDAGGDVPEPTWYATLCLLGACADGEHFAHEWSKGDERYSHADTARKLDQARANSGPTTCAKFQSLNPDGCVGCPHFSAITSPIQLGRGAEQEKITVVQDVTLPPAPWPFRRSPNGALMLDIPNEEGVREATIIYKAPLFLESIREHENGGGTALLVKHWLPHEGWLDALVPWSDRSQKAVINSLAAQKVNVPRAHERHILYFLERAIDEFQAQRKTAMEYGQFGWRDGFQEFVLGNELFRVGQPKPMMIGVSPELSARTKQMRAYGTFEAWRSAVQPLFVHEQQGLMVLAGFASILMRFVQELTGVIVAAVSPEPRLGKTMGLIAARSIWGDDNAIDIATNDTANSRFRMLAVLNGLPATWDDMRKSNDPEIIKQFVLSFSQGRDKNRLEKSGALRSNTTGWSSVLLATSNISIAELVGHDGETAQQARILEYRFKPMAGTKFSDGQQYERVMRQNRGTAGRRFVQCLMVPGMVDWLKIAVPQSVREFEEALGRSDASFYASFLGCAKVAGILLNRCDLLEFSVDRVMNFAVESAMKMGSIMEDNKVVTTEALVRFINDNWPNTLVVTDGWKPRTECAIVKAPHGKLFIRYEQKPQRVYIDRQALKEWCRTKNIMFRDIGQKLLDEDVALSLTRKINLGAGTPYAGAGQTLTWEIDSGHPHLGGLREIERENQIPPLPRGERTTVYPDEVKKRVLTPGKLQDAP